MSVLKYVKWFLVSIAVVMLTACGGGGSSDSESTDNESAKVIYEIKSDVVELSDRLMLSKEQMKRQCL